MLKTQRVKKVELKIFIFQELKDRTKYLSHVPTTELDSEDIVKKVQLKAKLVWQVKNIDIVEYNIKNLSPWR